MWHFIPAQSTRDYLRLFAKLIWTSNPQMLQHSDCSASSRAWGPAIPVDFSIIAGMPFHGDPDKRQA